MTRNLLLIGLAALGLLAALALAFRPGRPPRPAPADAPADPPAAAASPAPEPDPALKTATLGGGCFWCVEAVFQELQGVHRVVSGYAGGHTKNPTYEQVCTGTTGHAEVVRLWYDPAVVSFADILAVFWKTHDPTTPDRQGHDVGPQYRSIILYEDADQRREAEALKARLDAAGAFDRPIVTEIAPLTDFYAAEDGHQNYFRSNPRQPYCRMVVQPKLEKFRAAFRDRRKE